MGDDRPPMPPQPTTKELPALTDRALLEDLSRTVREGFRSAAANAELLAGEVKSVKSDISGLKRDVVELQDWRELSVLRAEKSSLKVKSISESDMSQESRIADTLLWRSAADNRFSAIENGVADLRKASSEQKKELAVNTSHTVESARILSGVFQKHPALLAALITAAIAALSAVAHLFNSIGGHP